MLERFTLPETHAIAIILNDHDKVKDLFDRFENAESVAEKEKIITKATTELKIHAVIEEEIFYPAVRRHVGTDIMNEADEEHHVARMLVAELDVIGREDDHRNAKFEVLAESVRHHIKEEEGEMLPKAKELDLDFEALGRQILARKKELQQDGVPADAEHAMVQQGQQGYGRVDTPASASRSSANRPKQSQEKQSRENMGRKRFEH